MLVDLGLLMRKFIVVREPFDGSYCIRWRFHLVFPHDSQYDRPSTHEHITCEDFKIENVVLVGVNLCVHI